MYLIYKIWFFVRFTLIKKYRFDYFIIFLGSFWLFAWLTSAPVFTDPDAFYHAKLAENLARGNIVRQFTWLEGTDLANSFTDQHFLYHAILAPFTIFFPTMIGLKLATALINAGLILMIYGLFKKFKITLPFFYLIPLLCSYPWLFRAGLIKAAPLFLILMIWVFHCLTKQKGAQLFIACFLGVWLYGAWPLLGLLAVLHFIITWFLEKYQAEESVLYKLKTVFLFNAKRKIVWAQELFYAGGGLLAGLVINFYFPQNLRFYWQQIWDIGVLNYQNIIAVGGEWYPYSLIALWQQAGFLLVAIDVSVLVFFLTIKKQSNYSWLWGILTLIFFLLTLKSQRYIDFFAPLATIFIGFTFNSYFKTLSRFHLKLLTRVHWQIMASSLLLILAIYFIWTTPANDYLVVAKTNLSRGYSMNTYTQASLWLKQNTPENSLILNTNWADFPMLFYHNDDNHYLTGLDSTFAYQTNPIKYLRYRNATLGKRPDLLRQVIIDDWNASYVFVNKKQTVLKSQLDALSELSKVYEDNEAAIYRVN